MPNVIARSSFAALAAFGFGTAIFAEPVPAFAQGDAPAPASSTAPAPASAEPPAPTKASEPFAFGDFTWLNGASRQKKAVLDTPDFTPEFLSTSTTPRRRRTRLTTRSSGRLRFRATTSSRSPSWDRRRLSLRQRARPPDDPVRRRAPMVVPRNDLSTFRGQFDLQTALRYISEAYGGYHWDAMHGMNLDVGIFMSYVGLFSYDNFENWMYLPSFTSDNTPWFFNGIRLQIFPTDNLKIEPWLINGWQTYGKFNEMPGFGAQLSSGPPSGSRCCRTITWVGTRRTTPGECGSTATTACSSDTTTTRRAESSRKEAFSVTVRHGRRARRRRHAVWRPPYSHTDNPANACRRRHERNTRAPASMFASWMPYNRLWFFDGALAWTVGGGMMHNPGRYLVLAPTGQASPFAQPLRPRTSRTSLRRHRSHESRDDVRRLRLRDGRSIHAERAGHLRPRVQPSPGERALLRGARRRDAPDGYVTTPVPTGWRPDLQKGDSRIILALSCASDRQRIVNETSDPREIFKRATVAAFLSTALGARLRMRARRRRRPLQPGLVA